MIAGDGAARRPGEPGGSSVEGEERPAGGRRSLHLHSLRQETPGRGEEGEGEESIAINYNEITRMATTRYALKSF